MKEKPIKVLNKDNKSEVYISGDIVDDAWKGWSWSEDVETYPEDIRTTFKDLSGDVDVYISSGGGDLFAGMAISNILKRYKNGKTKAIIDGLAASAASIIAFGCDEIEIPSNAYLMIHKPMIGLMGNSDDLLKWADTLDELQKGLVETYMSLAKEGTTREEINNLINKETWFTGKSASEFFNVQVADPVKLTNNYGASICNYVNTPKKLKEADTEVTNYKDEVETALLIY